MRKVQDQARARRIGAHESLSQRDRARAREAVLCRRKQRERGAEVEPHVKRKKLFSASAASAPISQRERGSDPSRLTFPAGLVT
jgi:hypothetical protein